MTRVRIGPIVRDAEHAPFAMRISLNIAVECPLEASMPPLSTCTLMTVLMGEMSESSSCERRQRKREPM